MNPPTPPTPTPPDPEGKPSKDAQAGGTPQEPPESDPHLSERLDTYYKSRKEAGDLQTTEIPISMLMAMDRLAKLGGDPSRLAQGAPTAAQNPAPIPGHPESPASGLAGRDPESVRELSGHLKRVAAFAKLLALKTGMSEKEANFVKQISPMHDIGKWAIPEAILQKPGSLTPDEWEIMKTHTSVGYEMLKDSKLEVLRMGALVAVQHQEKYDGTGYPSGLKGDEIHIYSRITTVADVFDALGSERSYKQAWAMEDIVQYFQEGRGTHFDPVLVDLLLAHIDEFLAIRQTLV